MVAVRARMEAMRAADLAMRKTDYSGLCTHPELRVRPVHSFPKPTDPDFLAEWDPKLLYGLLGTGNPWTGPLLPLSHFAVRATLTSTPPFEGYIVHILRFRLCNLVDVTHIDIGYVHIHVHADTDRVHGDTFTLIQDLTVRTVNDIFERRMGLSLRGLLPAALRILLRDVLIPEGVSGRVAMTVEANGGPENRVNKNQTRLIEYYKSLGFTPEDGDDYVVGYDQGGVKMRASSLTRVLRCVADVCRWSSGGPASHHTDPQGNRYWTLRPVTGDATWLEGQMVQEYEYTTPPQSLRGLEPLVTRRRTPDERTAIATRILHRKHQTEHDETEQADAQRQRMQARMRVLEMHV